MSDRLFGIICASLITAPVVLLVVGELFALKTRWIDAAFLTVIGGVLVVLWLAALAGQ